MVLPLMQSQMLFLCGALAILVQSQAIEVFFSAIILEVSLVLFRGVWARLMAKSGSQEGCLPCSQAAGDPPTAEKLPVAGWDSLPNDVHANILRRLEFRDRLRFKAVSKDSMKVIEGDVFRQLRDEVFEGTFTAISYYIKNGTWRSRGYDLLSKSWRTFPTLSYLPPPDAELFKEYSVCGHGGLMCAEVSKLPNKGVLVVFNPLTRESQALPPLRHPRIPVLVNISVDSATKSYKVVVAGSSSASDEHLSKKVEVFDSLTSKWKEVCDVPSPAFGLNEHQAGVCLDGKLLFISFLENGGRGVVAYDLEEETWLQDLTAPIPWSSYSNTLQLVESDGKLFLFSEQEQGPSVEHCIDELEFPNPEAGVLTSRWRNVVQSVQSGGRGLQVYPEYTCVGFGAGKLCVFNTLNRHGVVYDMRDGEKCDDLESPPAHQTGDHFFSLNPASFTLEPNFDIEPCYPISVDSDQSVPNSVDSGPSVPNSVDSDPSVPVDSYPSVAGLLLCEGGSTSSFGLHVESNAPQRPVNYT